MNYGIGAHFSLGLKAGKASRRVTPYKQWRLLEGTPTTTCLQPNPEQTPVEALPSYVMPTDAAAPVPTDGGKPTDEWVAVEMRPVSNPEAFLPHIVANETVLRAQS